MGPPIGSTARVVGHFAGGLLVKFDHTLTEAEKTELFGQVSYFHAQGETKKSAFWVQDVLPDGTLRLVELLGDSKR